MIQDANTDMRHARLSIVVFGAYVLGLGVALVVAPNFVLAIFGIPETGEVWIRILGAVLAVNGYYLIEAGRLGSRWFMRASVFGRAGVAAFLFALVLAGIAPPVMILFATVDLAGAIWTAVTLRSSRGARLQVGEGQ